MFDRTKINKNEDYEGHLLVSVKAEDESFERTPVQVTLVIDTSGSMGWGDSTTTKIQAVKDTARKVVENLTGKDEISIITFANSVEVILPRCKVDDKERIYSLINNIRASGCTNFSGGLIQGLSEVGEDFEGVKRLMVLTDGRPTAGMQEPEGLLNLVKDRDSTSTISFFGFGSDCDTELLSSLSKVGGGNYYFIESTEDVNAVFSRELGGLISCKGQNIEIVVDPSEGNEILEVMNDYTVEDVDGKAKINAEDIYVGESKYILIKMKIAKPQSKPKPRPVTIATVEVSYFDLDEKKKDSVTLRPKVQFVTESKADEKVKMEVGEKVAAIEAAQAQKKAVTLANKGDFAGAQSFFSSAVGKLQDCADQGSDYAENLVGAYGSSMDDFTESNYSADIGEGLTASAMGFTRCRSVGRSALSKKMDNKSMKDMTKKFEDDLVGDPEDLKEDCQKFDNDLVGDPEDLKKDCQKFDNDLVGDPEDLKKAKVNSGSERKSFSKRSSR